MFRQNLSWGGSLACHGTAGRHGSKRHHVCPGSLSLLLKWPFAFFLRIPMNKTPTSESPSSTPSLSSMPKFPRGRRRCAPLGIAVLLLVAVVRGASREYRAQLWNSFWISSTLCLSPAHAGCEEQPHERGHGRRPCHAKFSG